MFFRATHAGREVFETIHMEPTAAITGRYDSLALGQAFHPLYHLGLERSTVIFFLGLIRTLAGSWQQRRWRIRYRNGRVHQVLGFRFCILRGSAQAGGYQFRRLRGRFGSGWDGGGGSIVGGTSSVLVMV